MAQLALNTKVLDITRVTLFFVNYDKKFNLFEEERKHHSISHRKDSDIKKDIRKHLQDARKVDQVLKQKTKNDILTKGEK